MRMAETRRKSQQISAISRNFGEIIVALLCDYIIPAHAGIHCPTTPMPEKNTPSFPQRREFTVPLPQKKYSVIPAKAGIHIPAHAGMTLR